MKLNKKILVYILGALGLFALGRYTAPVSTKTEVKVVEVIKEVEKKNEIKRERVIEKPDGTKVTERTTETHTERETDTFKDSQKKESKTTTKQWSIGVYKNIIGDSYTLTVDRQILGPIYLGVYGRSDSEFGFGIRFEF